MGIVGPAGATHPLPGKVYALATRMEAFFLREAISPRSTAEGFSIHLYAGDKSVACMSPAGPIAGNNYHQVIMWKMKLADFGPSFGERTVGDKWIMDYEPLMQGVTDVNGLLYSGASVTDDDLRSANDYLFNKWQKVEKVIQNVDQISRQAPIFN
ncbi:MAG: hypothetical protein PHF00_11185 [Elusimicrobia bacterium]|nr:hypothetical protein [Elusimicrobiota bacterium]